jgi:hypothetical protein
MNLSKAMPGLWIDGSHMGNLEFMMSVIEFAHDDYGFELEWDQFVKDAANLREPGYMMEEDELNEVLDAIDWTYEDALEYLNDNTREGLYWEVIDQSLFLMTEEDAENE